MPEVLRTASRSTPGGVVLGEAVFYGPNEEWRYVLRRTWLPGGRRVLFILLNPSTATELELDPTLTRCQNYARAWGYGGFDVANIFALRSTDPRGLRGAEDPIGPGNDAAILREHGASSLTVVGWGVHGEYLGRGQAVAEMLLETGKPVHCLGRTKAGHPVHPLYQPADAELLPWPG